MAISRRATRDHLEARATGRIVEMVPRSRSSVPGGFRERTSKATPRPAGLPTRRNAGTASRTCRRTARIPRPSRSATRCSGCERRPHSDDRKAFASGLDRLRSTSRLARTPSRDDLRLPLQCSRDQCQSVKVRASTEDRRAAREQARRSKKPPIRSARS